MISECWKALDTLTRAQSHESSGVSPARYSWVSDDIIFNSRVGANVMDKVIVDMTDRAVLPIEQGSPAGWVSGGAGGIDRFRFDPHEFPNATPFFIRNIKLAALERVSSGSLYTLRWSASEGNGTVTLVLRHRSEPVERPNAHWQRGNLCRRVQLDRAEYRGW